MNVLLLVLGFLMILSFGAHTMIKGILDTAQQKQWHTSYLNLECKARNCAHKEQFKKIKDTGAKSEEKPPSSPAVLKPEKTQERQRVTRDKENPSAQSKLNLFPLLHTSPPLLHEIAAKLLRQLYGGTQIEQLAKEKGIESFEYALLDQLIKRGKGQETLSFAELMPESKHLREIYYKMLKGTHAYTLSPKEGYPPLEDFFLLDADKARKPIFFCFASTPLLIAAFGSEITDLIVKEEVKKGAGKRSYVPLSRKSLEPLLAEQKFSFPEIKPYLSFERTGVGTETRLVSDKATKMSLKRKI